MKKFLLSAIAVSMVASPMIAAPAMAAPLQRGHKTVVVKKQIKRAPVRQNYRQANQRYNRQDKRNWRRGERFDYRQARNYRVVNDYRNHHLAPPPRGYHYVQSGNDAVLVAIAGGLIGAIFAGALN